MRGSREGETSNKVLRHKIILIAIIQDEGGQDILYFTLMSEQRCRCGGVVIKSHKQ